MKKIISLIMGVVMITSAFATTALAAIDTAIPEKISIVTQSPVEVSADDYSMATGGSLPSGYTAYKVVAGLSGTGGVNGTNSRNAIGKMISNFSYFLDFENIENLLTGDDIYVTDGVYTDAIKPSDGGDAWVKKDGSIYRYGFVSNNMFPGAKIVEYQDDGLASLLTMYFAVKTGTSVKATVSTDSGVAIGNYTTSGSTDMKTYSPTLNTITLAPATITLGTAAGGGSTVTATAGETVNNITAYTIANDTEGVSRVLVKTFENVTISDSSRVHVKIGDRRQTFGSDLAEKASGITAGTVTFGIIVDASISASDVLEFVFE